LHKNHRLEYAICIRQRQMETDPLLSPLRWRVRTVSRSCCSPAAMAR
jgi:hypothetical protein